MIIIGVFLFGAGHSAADAVICPPSGIYCSCPPTTSFSHSVVPSVAALPFVDGTLVRVLWADLEPAPGVFDWTILDAELQRAIDNDTQVSLGIVCGATGEPDWLYQPAGAAPAAEAFEFFFRCNPEIEPCVAERMPLPWDGRFLDEWTAFIAALGQRYNDHPQITLVHMTSATANGFEMQLPSTPTDTQNWNAAGYTTALHVASWETIIDAFAAAFPDKPLDVDVHPVLASDSVAEMVVDDASATIGERFGVFSAWWTQHNAHDVYPGMYDLLQASAMSSYASVQFARSETQHGASSFGDGGVVGALQRVLEDDIIYAEIWNSDLLNTTFQTDFAVGADALRIQPGDLDADGAVGPSDVPPFVAAIIDSASTTTATRCRADINQDGALDSLDVEGFVTSLLAP
ncbi:MAG TPA: beta-galactosidase [Phycisphaerae bacterium]|nr:beta-galactosidase [Phycisphaerae bacterium]HRW52671.1 beta-galactosidase [Phycisphaerae bacterium]